MQKTKGGTNDVTGPMVSSTEDADRLDRTASVSTGRQWDDLPAKVLICPLAFCFSVLKCHLKFLVRVIFRVCRGPTEKQ